MDSKRSSMGESTRRRLAAAIDTAKYNNSNHSISRVTTNGLVDRRPSTSPCVRVQIRRNSEGAKNLWDSNSNKPTQQGFYKKQERASKTRPRSAFVRKKEAFVGDGASTIPVHIQGSAWGKPRHVRGAQFQNNDSWDLIRVASECLFEDDAHVVEECTPIVNKDKRYSFDRLQKHNKSPERTLEALQKAFKKALRTKRNVHETEQDVLQQALKDAGFRGGELTPDILYKAGRLLGMKVSRQEISNVIPSNGTLTFPELCNKLLGDDTQQSTEIHKGALSVEKDLNFQGKIVYPHCRSTVCTPSNWSSENLKRSALLPTARLQLEFVYGYAGLTNTSQNLFVNHEGNLVYYTAGVGVVYSCFEAARRQWFFLGHNDDIKSIALSQEEISYKNEVFPSGSLAATGQVSSHDGGPYVCIWSTKATSKGVQLPEICRLDFAKSDRGIIALTFSTCSKYLITIAMDNSHTVSVFNWRKQSVIFTDKGITGTPPQVYGVKYDAFSRDSTRFATFGKKHMKVWKELNKDEGEKRWKSSTLRFGKHPIQNIHNVEFLPPQNGAAGLIVAGMGAGDLYLIKEMQIIKTLPAHRPGSKIRGEDGGLCFGGVRGMCLIQEKRILVTGGADGVLLFWDVCDGAISDGRMAKQSIVLDSGTMYFEGHPAVRALCHHSTTGALITGTIGCDIVSISEAEKVVVMQGHGSDLYFLAVHPTKAEIFATVCDSSWLFVLNAKQRDVITAAEMGFKLRSVAFSNKPHSFRHHHIAVGGAKGRVKIIEESDLQTVFTTRDVHGSVNDLKYSPEDLYLAVGSADAVVDVYDVRRDYQRIARCQGHSASVRQLDWSLDCQILQSSCAAYELLYWNPKTGKQVKDCQRDTAWSTWTSILGFPVMGIWSDVGDGSNMNACHRSNTSEYVVTSGDDGLVKLYNFPCVIEDAPYRAYRGHSSHVMCVRFSCNDQRVFTAGGKDRAVFQSLITNQ